jgi:hypothetical protein
MEHVNVLLKDIPECMHVVFGCNRTSKVILETYLENGNYELMANKLKMLGVDLWLPSYVDMTTIGLGNSVLLCKKGDDSDRLGDGTLWLPGKKE